MFNLIACVYFLNFLNLLTVDVKAEADGNISGTMRRGGPRCNRAACAGSVTTVELTRWASG